MRFATPAINSAIYAASRNSTSRFVQQQSFASMRQFSSKHQVRKGDTRIILGALLGAGILGGVAYNTLSGPEKRGDKVAAFGMTRNTSLTLTEIEPVSSDTNRYRFELPEGKFANLPTASFLLISHKTLQGKAVTRPYTPVSEPDTDGHIDLVIKSYKDGQLSPAMRELKPGDQVKFRGPIVTYDWNKNKKSNVGLIAGGAGITPMLQLIRGVFNDESSSNTKITLLFGNQTEQDILLKDELDKIAKEHPDRFKVVYALDRAPENWSGVSGYITKDVVKEYMPSPDDKDAVIMVCGPPPMVKSIAGPESFVGQGTFGGILKELGYNKKNVYKF